jgi:exopolyphosphatase/pppGpp-phosphohydrolase
LEVVTGATVDPLQINAHQSLDLGTTRLMKTFADCGSDVDKFTSWVRGELDLQALPVPGDKCGGIVQGSVVTKAKWLPLRNRTDERYDPAKVQGLPMTTEALTRVATLARQLPRSQWNRLRGWLGPHSHSDELERLISGSLAIEEVLRRLDIRTFAVSGYGTRYGVAFELGIGALTQQRPNIPE